MTRVGIRHLSFTLGEEKIWYRDLPAIEERIQTLQIPDDEELWEWGWCRRATRDYDAHVAHGYGDVVRYVQASGVRIDAVLACGPVQHDAERFAERLSADVLPQIDGAAGRLRRIDDFDCANALQGVADARALIASGAENVLVLAGEKLENEQIRFRSYSVFSDFTFALLLSADTAGCDYEVLDLEMGRDEQPAEDTSRILVRTLEKEIGVALLARNGISAEDVTKFFYLNLFPPIAEMKTKDSGFAARHFYSEARESGHCYGADPFMNLDGYFANGGGGELHVLCASGRGHAGVSLVRRLR